MSDHDNTLVNLLRVRWRDTDASGFANTAAYITWMEETEYAFLRSRDLSVVLKDEKGLIGFPRLRSELEVSNHAVFEDELAVAIELCEFDGKQMSYRFLITRPSDEVRIAAGKFTVACCRFLDDQMPFAILIPGWIEEKLL